MCGIAGFIDEKQSREQGVQTTEKMLRSIRHRGPEASDVYAEGPVFLGHNRLKIIDLSDAANQPFSYGDVVLVFNGEVYNYIELRAELQQLGYAFRTQGDSEVICAAYMQYGENCVSRFVGMWAFALWDKKKKQLFCSRDRFGIKPFYYISDGESFCFASETKALKAIRSFNSAVCKDQVNLGLQMVWSGFGSQTFYDRVVALEPAHNLIWRNGKFTVSRYWDIDFTNPKSNLSFGEKKETFRQLFEQSVRLHARSDVPNGTCLSGGLDSSAIASMYSVVLNAAPIKSFTVYYPDDVDERPFVEEVVRKYPNVHPNYFSPSENDIAEHFHHMAYHADVPVLGSSFMSQYFLMRLAAGEGVTVVIDGQGADEYLGGYLHSFYRIIGQQLRSGNLTGAFSLFGNLSGREHFSAQKKFDFLAKSLVSGFAGEQQIYNLELSRLNKFLNRPAEKIHLHDNAGNQFDSFLYHLLLRTTLQTLLHFEDRNSMAFSLESRVPFLDHRLVEFAFSLQREDRINNKAETKYIMREALKEVLPDAIYARKDKKGFVTPGEVKWLNGPLRFLLDIDYSRFDWMKRNQLKQLVEDYKKGDTSNAAFIWRLACTHYWLKHFA